MMLQRFERNTQGRDIAVGDIHGCFSQLQAELVRIGFDPEVDRLFSVGDLVDRGPENEAVLQWLAKPWFHAVMGNHDDMAHRWPAGNMQQDIYRRNGGGWNIDQPKEDQMAISEAMGNLPVAIEIDTAHGAIGIVHADCPFDSWRDFAETLLDESVAASMKGRIADVAMWSRGRISEDDRSGVTHVRAVIVGHTPVQAPVVLGNVHHIDTGAVFGRKFTLLELETLEVL